jgi:uncharacterized membrane protein
MTPEQIEQIANSLIIFHAACGGVALVAGVPALIYKKGSQPHILAGRVFFYGMLLASISALIVSRMPEHESLFLFVIGVFSAFLITTGYRSLKIKKNAKKINWLDHLVHASMLAAAVYMAYVGFNIESGFRYVMLLFAGIAFFMLIQDSGFLYLGKVKKSNWMVRHLVRMIAGYISATTAFIVVNQILPGLVGWIAPTVIGSILIIIYARRYSK